jgi:Asp-tRNA(Asn)/Glu-tRNA(Gln) amidotransferase A subunit family amidase
VFAPTVEWVERAAAVLCEGWGGGAAAARGALAIPTGPLLEAADPAGREHFAGVCSRLRAAGWGLLEVPVLANFARVVERHRLVVAAEAARFHRPWLSRFRSLYRAPTLELIDRGEVIPDAELAALLQECAGLREELEEARRRAGAIAWVCPAAKGPAPRGLESTGDPVMNLPWTQSGLPAVVVPAGFVGHLPMGLQLVGEWWGDEALLALAVQLATVVDPVCEESSS